MQQEIDFDNLKVKLITEYFELSDAEALLSRYHPLGVRKAIGSRLWYSVSCRGEWMAILLFDGAVKRNKRREMHIGWSDAQRSGRLVHIANNSRSLLSPQYADTKDLASKILSLVTERISADWIRRYGIPLLAVETYVDSEHKDNQGTCYTAAGWENLGYSSGYQADGEERTHSKWYFLKALNSDSDSALRSEMPHALLTGVKDASGKSNNNNYVLDASKFNLKSLQKDLCLINDPRGKQGQRYRFLPLLSLCIAATISGYTQYRQIADWIANLPAPDRARFGLRGDCVPDETTISQFLRKIDPEQLQTVLSGWLQKTYQKDAQFSTVTLDGKALRATSSDTKEQRAFLNVFASELGIVIAHKPTSKGGGEKNTAREVLRSDIDLEGKIVLADAIHTDRTTIKEIENKKASYVFTVKGNQRYLEEELADIFKHTREQYPELLYSHECIEKGHGRLERRSISVLSTEHTKLLFPGVQQVAHLRRTRENLKTGRKSEDEVFLISDSPFERVTAEQLMKLKREYWEIENKLHYRRDFVFGEDRSTIRAQHGPQNMASLCNFAIGLLTNLGIDNIKRCVDNLRHDPQCLIRQPVLDDRRMAA